jgi:hypothetical protein
LASNTGRLFVLLASVHCVVDLGEVEEMTLDVFWQRIESAIMDYGECDVCPVHEYAHETNTERMCDKVGDCADGLKMLHKLLQEERQKMDKERESNDD